MRTTTIRAIKGLAVNIEEAALNVNVQISLLLKLAYTENGISVNLPSIKKVPEIKKS